MAWEDKLLAIPSDQWVVDKVISFDWHDGPLQGWCSLTNPLVDFVFECVEEQHDANGLDVRKFHVKELPSGSVDKALALLAPILGSPRKPVWCPIWKFPNEHKRSEVEQIIDSVAGRARATNLLITTADMNRFASCTRLNEFKIASSPASLSNLMPNEPNPS